MSDFAADISKWVKKAKDRNDAFVAEFTQDVAEEVVRLSPVDTGFFRNAWVGEIGTPNLDYLPDASQVSPSGVNPDIAIILSNARAGDVVYINNNAPYANRLEYGYSDQAPNGMVRITVAKADSIARNALRKVKARVK